jgi:hypothetical protein
MYAPIPYFKKLLSGFIQSLWLQAVHIYVCMYVIQEIIISIPF